MSHFKMLFENRDFIYFTLAFPSTLMSTVPTEFFAANLNLLSKCHLHIKCVKHQDCYDKWHEKQKFPLHIPRIYHDFHYYPSIFFLQMTALGVRGSLSQRVTRTAPYNTIFHPTPQLHHHHNRMSSEDFKPTWLNTKMYSEVYMQDKNYQ